MYNCECCKYVTSKRFNYNKHLLSTKHKLIAGLTPTATKVAIKCNYCKKEFKGNNSDHAQCKQIHDLTELIRKINDRLEEQQKQINAQKLQIDHIISEIF